MQMQSAGQPFEPPGHTLVDDGLVLHIMPVRTHVDFTTVYPPDVSTSGLKWWGGHVQHTPKIYLIFWGSAWTTSNSVYNTAIKFLRGLSGSQWNGAVAQYYDSTAHISNDAAVSGIWIDTSSVPSSPTSSQVGAEAERGVKHFGYAGAIANYVVAIEHAHSPSGFGTQWCAWHSEESETQGTVSFTDLPYMPDAGWACGAGSVNSPGTNDGVSIVGGHEEAETQTDPQLHGWYDSKGYEIGDLCAWQHLQNTSFSTGVFPTQPLYSDSAKGCVQ
jgi:serine protease